MADAFLRVIEIKQAEWEKLKARAVSDKWKFPITLSSNCMGDVWYARKHGYHHESEREYISYNDYPFLADIHDEVLKMELGGARFHIDYDEVRQAKNFRTVCQIKIV